MGMRAAVAGASGYAGGELARLLLGHPEIELGPLTAGSHAGAPVASVHPHLAQSGNRYFLATEPEVLADADVAFLALPHGESAALVPRLPADLAIVDLGADFRLRDPHLWRRFYGTPYAGHWSYGLAELPGGRGQIRGSRRVANPGCYATAVTLALAPLLTAGLIEPTDIVVVAASGTSGAGRAPKSNLLASEVMGALSAYKVGGVHQHTPEIEQTLTEAAGVPVTLSFTPVLAPMPRGILATCTARSSPQATAARLREAVGGWYADEPFVHLLPEDVWPTTKAVLGSNAVHLQVAHDSHVGRAIVVAAIDNLGKGAAGQAVQNANLMLGLEETAGLSPAGVAP